MIHLETAHLIVKEAILNRFKSDKDETVDVRVADFDNASYHIAVASENRSVMTVSVCVRDCKKLMTVGKDFIQDLYGDYLAAEPLTGFDLTLNVDLASLPASDEGKEALAEKLAAVKRNVMAAPFICCGKALQAGSPLSEASAFEFRQDEFLYVIPLDDRVVVIYDMAFKDQTDFAIAKIFLQEFNEVRRLRELAPSPYPTFSPDPPMEVTEDPKLKATLKPNPQRIGYVSFAFQKRHIEEERIENSADHIVQFRAYIHYHIKCSKSHMHSRMRKRVELLLKVLNRAIPEIPKDRQTKTTASGRVFKMSGGAAAGL